MSSELSSELSRFSFSDLLPADVFGDATFSGDDDGVSGGPSIDDFLSGDEFGAAMKRRAASLPARIIISGTIGGTATGYDIIAAGNPWQVEFQLGYKLRIRKVCLLNAVALTVNKIDINGVNQVLGGAGASGALFNSDNNVEILLKPIPANTKVAISGFNASAAPVAVSFGALADVL